jgi:hypothetical protein
VLPAADVYAGGKNRPVVVVELKLPNIGLPSIESCAAFVHAATDVVDELTGPDHLRENTWPTSSMPRTAAGASPAGP